MSDLLPFVAQSNPCRPPVSDLPALASASPTSAESSRLDMAAERVLESNRLISPGDALE